MTAQDHNSRRRTGLLTLGAVLLLAGIFCLRIPLARDRYFDPDELQHLQIAFLISQGRVPHQDFFEHHNHLLHYLLIPLLRRDHPETAIFSGRILMLVLAGAAAFLTWLLGRSFAGTGTGLLAALGLLTDYIFLVKTTEIRPDNLALVWLLLAVILSGSAIRGGRPSHWFLIGFSSALAIASTQKALFPLLGLAAGLVLFRARTAAANAGRPGGGRRRAVSAAAGFLLGLSLYLAYFIHTGSLAGMVRETVLFNLAWRYRCSPLIVLRQFALFNPAFLFWAGAGLVRTGVVLWRLPGRETRKAPAFFALLGGVAGLFIIPVPYAQYFTLFTPLAYVVAAEAAVGCFNFLRNAGLRTRALAGVVLVLPILPPIYLRYVAGYSYELPLERTGFWLGFTAAGFGLGYLILLLVRSRAGNWLAAGALLAAVAVRPVNLAISSHRHTNRRYLELIDTVQRSTAADDRVFDGWTVLGLFRFPAYYYNFLHSEIFALMSREERGPALLRSLKDRPPEIFIREDSWVKLPAEVYDFIEANYTVIADTSLGGVPIRIYQRNPRPPAENHG